MRLVLALLLLLLTPTRAAAPPPLPPPVASDAAVDVPDALRALALPLPEDVLEALRDRAHDDAVTRLLAMDTRALVGSQRADHAFLVAWSLVHAGRADEGVPWLERFSQLGTAPLPYRAVVRGEILRAAGDLTGALAALSQVDDDDRLAPRAWVVHAEVLRELGRTRESGELYASVVARPDPAEGNAVALLALAQRRGLGSPAATELLRRVWTWYPWTDEGAKAARALEGSPDFTPTAHERAIRAEQWMSAGVYGKALETSEGLDAALPVGSMDWCRVRFVRGRALYKRNELSNALAAFGDAGARCVEADGEYGHRVLYLAGQAHFRKGAFTSSAATYRAIADLYPETSYADDGLTRAGIALQEHGDLEGALAVWREALARFPEGDTVPEATFRLAFNLYRTGRTAEAIEAADRLAALPWTQDPVHVPAGAYWAARWRLYPDADDPRRLEPSGRAVGVAGLRAVVERWPHHYYALLAYARLAELAPEQARALDALPRPVHEDRPWRVRARFLEHPAVGYGVALARLGLSREALAEWDRAGLDAATADERAWLLELREATGDWLGAFKDGHAWVQATPPGSWGERDPEIARLLFPDRYGAEVREATAGFGYPARMFHGLVREESTFDRRIRSHAGAIGLAQLMPGTARQVAGWLGRAVGDLDDPANNLTLGARYFESVHKQVGRNPFLAMASYNAGPARVMQWVEQWDDPPLDEWVERIPFRETRGYVKRVTTSWQTMRWYLDVDEPPFEDLSRFNHRAIVP